MASTVTNSPCRALTAGVDSKPRQPAPQDKPRKLYGADIKAVIGRRLQIDRARCPASSRVINRGWLAISDAVRSSASCVPAISTVISALPSAGASIIVTRQGITDNRQTGYRIPAAAVSPDCSVTVVKEDLDWRFASHHSPVPVRVSRYVPALRSLIVVKPSPLTDKAPGFAGGETAAHRFV